MLFIRTNFVINLSSPYIGECFTNSEFKTNCHFTTLLSYFVLKSCKIIYFLGALEKNAV